MAAAQQENLQLLAFALPRFLPHDESGSRSASVRAAIREKFGLPEGALDPDFQTELLGQMRDGKGRYVYTARGRADMLGALAGDEAVTFLKAGEIDGPQDTDADILAGSQVMRRLDRLFEILAYPPYRVVEFSTAMSPMGLQETYGNKRDALRQIAKKALGLEDADIKDGGVLRATGETRRLLPVGSTGEKGNAGLSEHVYEIELAAAAADRVEGAQLRRKQKFTHAEGPDGEGERLTAELRGHLRDHTARHLPPDLLQRLAEFREASDTATAQPPMAEEHGPETAAPESVREDAAPVAPAQVAETAVVAEEAPVAPAPQEEAVRPSFTPVTVLSPMTTEGHAVVQPAVAAPSHARVSFFVEGVVSPVFASEAARAEFASNAAVAAFAAAGVGPGDILTSSGKAPEVQNLSGRKVLVQVDVAAPAAERIKAGGSKTFPALERVGKLSK